MNLEAYQLFLKGRQCMNRFTEVELRRALEYFDRAVGIDPRYAPAHSQTAWVYLILALGHGAASLRPRDAHACAKEAVARALEADPLLGDAHGPLGTLRFMADYDWVGAEQSFRRGIELSPGNSLVLDSFGLLLGGSGTVRRGNRGTAARARTQSARARLDVRPGDDVPACWAI